MERINALIVGAPRQGKTYFAEKRLIEYARRGGTAVVYNVGRPGDFANFIPVHIVSAQEYKRGWELKNRKRLPMWEMPSEISFFSVAGKTYHIKDFSKVLKGKCVKIERLFNDGAARSEDFFIAAIYKYFYNTMIVFDDCRTIFRKGLSSEMVGLLSRVNHAGKSATANPGLIGVDVALVYHGFDTVNIETYQFNNLLCQFKTMYEPRTRIDNEELSEMILANFYALRDLPKYSHFEVDPMTGANTLLKP